MKPFVKWEAIVSIGMFLILWEIIPRVGLIKSTFLPPLSDVLVTLTQLILSGELLTHTGISLKRALFGFLVAFFAGSTLGLGIGWYPTFARFVDPVLQLFRQTSAFALFPVFIFVFGIGEFSKVAVISYACVWPILLNTVNGVRNVDPYLIKCARSMAAGDWVIFQKVVIPSLIPSLATGVRLAGANAILLLVAAEMIGASAGLGFMIIDSQNTFQPTRLYSAIITMAVIGLSTNYFLVYLEKRATVWQEERHIA
jgi:NitT/TauT family transport system permease protein